MHGRPLSHLASMRNLISTASTHSAASIGLIKSIVTFIDVRTKSLSEPAG